MNKGPMKCQSRILDEINEEFGLMIGLASELSRIRSFSRKMIGINIVFDELKKAKKKD